ncbi:unnamed protein product [Victoria cruziana]
MLAVQMQKYRLFLQKNQEIQCQRIQ